MIRISTSIASRQWKQSCKLNGSSSSSSMSLSRVTSACNPLKDINENQQRQQQQYGQMRLISSMVKSNAVLGSTTMDSTFIGTARMNQNGGKRCFSSSKVACAAPIIPEDELLRKQEEAQAAAELSGIPVWDPAWYNPADQMINLLHAVHETSGLSYGLSIVAMTVTLRTFMLPLFVHSQRNASRMAHLKPEMDVLKEKVDRLGPNVDQETQMRMAMQMKALFAKYECNPLKALLVPVVQAPLFMSMFFGLRKVPDYFPDELSTGGMLWFPDLTQTDPLYILPITSIASFLIMIELGKDQMLQSNPAQGKLMLNFFRGVSVLMVPVTINFSTAVLTYWTVNNSISLAQTVAFKNPSIRKALDIWEPPKPVTGQSNSNNKGLMESIQEAVGNASKKDDAASQTDRIKAHNAAIEQRKQMEKITKEKSAAGRRKRRKPLRKK